MSYESWETFIFYIRVHFEFLIVNCRLGLKYQICMYFVLAQMKGCIKVLKDQPPSSVEGLLNALRSVGLVVGV